MRDEACGQRLGAGPVTIRDRIGEFTLRTDWLQPGWKGRVKHMEASLAAWAIAPGHLSAVAVEETTAPRAGPTTMRIMAGNRPTPKATSNHG